VTKLRIKQEYSKDVEHDTELGSLPNGASLQFSQQSPGGSCLAGLAVLTAGRNRGLDSGVAHFEIVFQLIGRHDADDGNAVLFEDEVLVAVMRPLGDLAEIDARLGDGESVNSIH
jgi:hypothetical protein